MDNASVILLQYNNWYFEISMVILGVANWGMRITQSDHAIVIVIVIVIV